jgi:hypothetical protein
VNETVTLDKLTYDVCKSLKNNDKETFKTYFDANSINSVSTSQFDYVFNNAAAIASKYDLPTYEIWKKERTFFNNDTIKKIIRVGLPFIAKATSAAPEYYFMLSYDQQILVSFNLQKTTTFENMPDRMFPNKKEKFEFVSEDLVKIKIYSLPGQNSDAENAKTVELEKNHLTNEIKNEFSIFLNQLNSSEIISSDKGSVKEQTNTNDLKAVVFTFKDGNDFLTLSVVNPAQQHKFVEVITFYSLNAAIIYQISDKDKAKINSLLDQFTSKYLK